MDIPAQQISNLQQYSFIIDPDVVSKTVHRAGTILDKYESIVRKKVCLSFYILVILFWFVSKNILQ